MFTSPTPTADPLLGAQVGSYRILKLLGTGGMGSVYLGEHTAIGSRVAIKFLHQHLSSSGDLVQRFYAEARSVNVIGHANIVSIFDMNVLPGNRYYLVMEYLEGVSLDALVNEGAVPLPRAAAVIAQVCDALDAAHTAGVVHRDLKPENVMLVKRGRQDDFVKLLDFGIAKLHSTMPGRKTATGIIVGTPDYMAPEQAQGGDIDGRVDQYSLGIIAYELTTGRTPFSGMPLTSMLVAHLSIEPKPPHEVNPAIPRAVSSVIMKALAKQPDARFRSCGDFGQAFELAVNETALIAATPGVQEIALKEPAAQRATPAPPDTNILRVTPALRSTPSPDRRSAVRFEVEVKGEDGKTQKLYCQELSHAGCFVASDDAPRLFSRLVMTFPTAGVLQADVVRHVTAEQSQLWKMPRGYAVQFVSPRPEQRDALEQLGTGRPVAAPTSSTPDDAMTEKLLGDVRKRLSGDHYMLLGLPSESEMGALRQRARELSSQLAELVKRKISDRQRKEIDVAQDRLRVAFEVLGSPVKRAEYDGSRMNWRGVNVCLTGGLRATEMEELRKKFLLKHDGVEARVAFMMLAANGHQRDGQNEQALRVIEQCLGIDPLNLDLHHRRRMLLRASAPKQ